MTSRLDHLPDDRRRQIVRDLDTLLQLDREALEAYEAAMSQLDDQEWAHQVDTFRDEHERHARNLENLITKLGGTPGTPPHRTSPFQDAVSRARGDDRKVLEALRNQEAHVKLTYDKFAAKEYPTEVTDVVKEHAKDEHDHHDWAADILGGGGTPSP